jgi:hypothetical protein
MNYSKYADLKAKTWDKDMKIKVERERNERRNKGSR